jgi:hypothetical protein
MTNEELIRSLKLLIFKESRDEHKTVEDGLEVGLLSNQGIYDNIENLMEYYKNREF